MGISLRNLLLFAIILGWGCVEQTQTQKDLKDLNRVISGIEGRQEIEVRVIQNEEKAIALLKENYKKVNSDGMREKIQRDITMKESVIEKSKKNQANQEELLSRLYAKRDSIVELEEITQ